MKSKKTFIKLFTLILCIVMGCSIFSGCGGFTASAEELSAMHLGNFANHDKKTSGCYLPTSSDGSTVASCDRKGKCTAPWFVTCVRDISTADADKHSIHIPLFHILGHIVVALNGGSASCQVKFCPVKGGTIDATPANAFNLGQDTGAELASKLDVEGIAMTILVTVWAYNFVVLVIQERFTMEAVFKGLCQLIVGAFVVRYGDKIVEAFVGLLGDGGSVGGANPFADSLAGKFQEDAPGFSFAINIPLIPCNFIAIGGWFDMPAMEAMLAGFLPAFACVKCAISIFSAVVLAKFELDLRIKAAPVLFALSSQTGWGQTQVGYIKQCMGAAAQVAIIGAVANQAHNLNLGVTGDLFVQGVGVMLSYMIVGGIVGQIGNITHQVFGH